MGGVLVAKDGVSVTGNSFGMNKKRCGGGGEAGCPAKLRAKSSKTDLAIQGSCFNETLCISS